MRRSNLSRVLVLGAAIAALGLAGCGRKGGLDPPPAAAADQGASNTDQRNVLGQPAGVTRDGRAIAPVGEKRSIPLDVLID